MKRLRIFAGPNGSGKSTIRQIVEDAGVHLGIYVNADDIKRNINDSHSFDFSLYLPQFDTERFWKSFEVSSLYKLAEGEKIKSSSVVKETVIYFSEEVNDYFTSFLSGYLREELLNTCEKFTFETVMSHPSKLDFIRRAREEKGFRIYLYFVSLEDPKMNIGRVESRVLQGGHDVPKQKIEERYARCMDLLFEAMKLADRVYFFDNSFSSPKLFASVEDNILIFEPYVEYMPGWFKHYVIDKLV